MNYLLLKKQEVSIMNVFFKPKKKISLYRDLTIKECIWGSELQLSELLEVYSFK